MHHTSQKPSHWLLGPSITLLLALASGCGDSLVDPEEEVGYRIESVQIIDLNLDANPVLKSVRIAVRFKRDSEILSTGQVTFAGQELSLEACQYCLDSLHWLVHNSTFAYTNSAQIIELFDETQFSDTLITSIPDSFTITNVVPADHRIEGSGQATLDWSGSGRAETYVLAAVLADSAYTGYGYSLYGTELTPSGTIPPDAFSLSPGPDPDTGLYNVYVYALAGSPDTALANALLPVPLPSQLADNVAQPDLTGRFGAVTVALLDTIRVVQQP